jgi:uncharacterized protein YdhG (YjbR/CyaY superfamily)
MAKTNFTDIDSYIAQAAPENQERLQRIRQMAGKLIPQATECISYQMPAYRDGRLFFYFAAFKKHIGIYPPVTEDVSLIEALTPYRNAKGNLSFPHKDPMPYELIERVILALHKQYY